MTVTAVTRTPRKKVSSGTKVGKKEANK